MTDFADPRNQWIPGLVVMVAGLIIGEVVGQFLGRGVGFKVGGLIGLYGQHLVLRSILHRHGVLPRVDANDE